MKPFSALGIIIGFLEILVARHFLLPLSKDSLHNQVKQILMHQEFAVLSFDSQDFNAEVQNVSNIFAASFQILDFFTVFNGFGDDFLKFQLTLLDQRLLYGYAFSLHVKCFALWIDIETCFS